jgi:ppGpp synthetase/RelA/SpoT-type nucleotidyltranferase
MFEDAWGEVDHLTRYPYYKEEPMLVDASLVLSGLSGKADTVSSLMYVQKNLFDSKKFRKFSKEQQMELIEKLQKITEHLKLLDDQFNEHNGPQSMETSAF